MRSNSGNEYFKQLTKTKKLSLAAIAVTSLLALYAAGVASNFFAQPMFSMFFIVSAQTAHTIVVYGAVGAAAAVGIVAVGLNLSKRGKDAAPSPKPAAKPTAKAKTKPAALAEALVNLKTQGNLGGVNQQETELPKPAPSISQAPKAEIENEVKTEAATVKPEAATENKDKIECPACKKEFSTPIFMLDYAQSKPKVVSYCPYCNQPLDTQKMNLNEQDIWNKYFKPSSPESLAR